MEPSKTIESYTLKIRVKHDEDNFYVADQIRDLLADSQQSYDWEILRVDELL